MNRQAIPVRSTSREPRRAPILLLKQDFCPPLFGGSRALYHELLRRQPPGDCTVLTGPGAADSDAFDRAQGYRVVRRDYLRTHPARGYLGIAGLQARCLLDLVLWLRRERGILLLGQMHWSTPVAAATHALTGAPLVVFLFGEELSKLGRRRTAAARLHRAVARRTLQRATAIIAISEFTRDVALGYGADAGAITLISPGVDAQRFSPSPGKTAPFDAPRLLTVARLIERKGIDTALRAFARIRERLPAATYEIVGDGPDRGRLEALARSLGIADRVRFLGRLSDDDLPDAYRRADVFVLPNRELPNADTEGFGMVLLEAGASGVPAVAGAAGGTGSAIVHGETGLLLDDPSPDNVAGAISRLLSTPEAWRAMRERARARALEQFSWDRAARRFAEVFESIRTGDT